MAQKLEKQPTKRTKSPRQLARMRERHLGMDVRVQAGYVLIMETLENARIEPQLRPAVLELAMSECEDRLMGYEDDWRYTGDTEFVAGTDVVEDALARVAHAGYGGSRRGRPRQAFGHPAEHGTNDHRAGQQRPATLLPGSGTRAQDAGHVRNHEGKAAPATAGLAGACPEEPAARAHRDDRVARAIKAAQEAGAEKVAQGHAIPAGIGTPVHPGIRMVPERDRGRAARRISRRIRDSAGVRDDEASRN